MKKTLAALIAIPVILAVFLLFHSPGKVYAQAVTELPETLKQGEWRSDKEVTFVGKMAARSKDVLDATIANYQWAYIYTNENPFTKLWSTIRNIVYGFMLLFVLAAAFILIITKGESLTVKRFIPRFIFIVLLVTLAFNIVQLLYAAGDFVQGTFLLKDRDSTPPVFISSKDLLNVSFNYGEFTGFRRFSTDGSGQFDESATVTLLLTRLTAATYFIMFIILTIRKVILWFFLIVSPVFPLLLFFWPIRNTAKIWIGEFFRWLLYAPLFAIFLAGLVSIWSATDGNTKNGIPVFSNKNQGLPCGSKLANDKIKYQTSVNILLGGPCQTLDPANNLNDTESFVQYVVALLMLWMVIIVPFILLKIFLDYMQNMNLGETNLVKMMLKAPQPKPIPPPPPAPSSVHFPPPAPSFPPPPPPAPPHLSAGLAREIGRPVTINVTNNIFNSKPQFKGDQATRQVNAQVSALANVSIPTLSDISKVEGMLLSNSVSEREQAHRLSESINRLAGTSKLTTSVEKAKMSEVRSKIQSQASLGNPVAASVMNTVSHVASASPEIQLATVQNTLSQEAKAGNQVAASIVSQPAGGGTPQEQLNQIKKQVTEAHANAKTPQEKAQAEKLKGVVEKTVEGSKLPESNSVQNVNLDEYEEVKRTWLQNYKRIEPPAASDGSPRTRKDWLKTETEDIPKAISLIISQNSQEEAQGKEMVSKILPFLLLGGFSKAEIVAYLKAKQEAAKAVLEELNKESTDDMVEVTAKKQETQKAMHAEAELPEDNEAPANAGGEGESNPPIPDALKPKPEGGEQHT